MPQPSASVTVESCVVGMPVTRRSNTSGRELWRVILWKGKARILAPDRIAMKTSEPRAACVMLASKTAARIATVMPGQSAVPLAQRPIAWAVMLT